MEVKLTLKQHDKSTILLGPVIAKGNFSGQEIEVIGSGEIIEVRVGSKSYRASIIPLVEHAILWMEEQIANPTTS